MARFPLGLLLALVVVLGGLVVSCDSSDPSGPVGDVSLPADFPRDQVPLLDGRLTQATGTRAEGWSLTVQGEYGGPNVFDAAVSNLEKDGYTESSRTGDGGTRTVILSKKHDRETYWVTVASSPRAAGGPNSVFYQVSVS
jgi:hypothetical protein